MNPRILSQWIDQLRLMLDDGLITCKQAAIYTVNYELVVWSLAAARSCTNG